MNVDGGIAVVFPCKQTTPTDMKPILSLLVLATAVLLPTRHADAHCQVPCGIFHDQLRFEAMLEDQVTIAKAGAEIAKYADETRSGVTALLVNQATRWVATKEEHAQRIQDTIASYFMEQRIKPDAEDYEKKLVAAHAVMRAAMKAKQDPSAEVAEALKAAILDFYRAYEGKEPQFDHEH